MTRSLCQVTGFGSAQELAQCVAWMQQALNLAHYLHLELCQLRFALLIKFTFLLTM